jgi:hypothetical protein
MAALDQTAAPGQGPAKKEFPKEDVELAFRLAVKLLNEGGGLKVIADSIQQSQDPAQVIGKFLAQLMGQLAEKLRDEAGIDPGIFIAKGGFLEHILDYIEQKLGYPSDFSDKIYAEVLDTIKAAAMQPTNPNQVSGPNAQPQGQPPAPAPQEGM